MLFIYVVQLSYICTTNKSVMATVKAFIRTTNKNKEANIRIRLSDGRDFSRYGTTRFKILPEYWDNKKEEIKSRVILPESIDKSLFNNSIRDIKGKIEGEFSKVSNKSLLPSNWIDILLQDNIQTQELESDLISLFRIYEEQAKVSDSRRKQIKVARGMLYRYLQFYSKNKFERGDVILFEEFLIDEHKYQYTNPELYKEERIIKKRGRNTLNSKLKIVKAFFSWALKNEYVIDYPFINYEFHPDIYGDPIPLFTEEVDYIYKSNVSKSLELTKDMFCLQCYTGCRIGDFINLKTDNINDNILIYIANKTIADKAETVYVPLVENAIDIIKKYNCEDGRLLPFININGNKGYNKKLKILAQYLKLDRTVIIINPITSKSETKKIHEVISSHTARKTFINSNYKETQDPALISKMTGHSENSKAFTRYRNIDIEILKEQVKKAFKKKQNRIN